MVIFISWCSSNSSYDNSSSCSFLNNLYNDWGGYDAWFDWARDTVWWICRVVGENGGGLII